MSTIQKPDHIEGHKGCRIPPMNSCERLAEIKKYLINSDAFNAMRARVNNLQAQGYADAEISIIFDELVKPLLMQRPVRLPEIDHFATEHPEIDKICADVRKEVSERIYGIRPDSTEQ